jgi:hypothetical protein
MNEPGAGELTRYQPRPALTTVSDKFRQLAASLACPFLAGCVSETGPAVAEEINDEITWLPDLGSLLSNLSSEGLFRIFVPHHMDAGSRQSERKLGRARANWHRVQLSVEKMSAAGKCGP